MHSAREPARAACDGQRRRGSSTVAGRRRELEPRPQAERSEAINENRHSASAGIAPALVRRRQLLLGDPLQVAMEVDAVGVLFGEGGDFA